MACLADADQRSSGEKMTAKSGPPGPAEHLLTRLLWAGNCATGVLVGGEF
jgi:hypothetical protein